jgi:malic enzyme
MFLAAAQALAEFTRAQNLTNGALYPTLRDLRTVSRLIALEVARTARDEGLGRNFTDGELDAAITNFCWVPDYPGECEAKPSIGQDLFHFSTSDCGLAVT